MFKSNYNYNVEHTAFATALTGVPDSKSRFHDYDDGCHLHRLKDFDDRPINQDGSGCRPIHRKGGP